MGLIVWIIVGLLAGLIARWIMPGPDPMGWLGTIVLGILGSLVGGTLINLLTGGSFDIAASGLIGSIIGALIVLWAWRQWGPSTARTGA